MITGHPVRRVALIEAGSPGLNIYSGVAMGRGLPLLATVLRDAGYDVRAFVEDISGKDTVDWEFVASADAVGFSAITCTLPRTLELMGRARAVNAKAAIIAGGPEPTCAPTRSLEAGADFVLRGEAEVSFPRLLRALDRSSTDTLADVPGLAWLEDGELREGPPPAQLGAAELAALPLVDRSLVHEADRAGVAPVWRARGCPERCDFCEVCRIWPRYAVRGDQQSIEELMEAQRAGYGCAFLIDDNAAANKPAFKEFLRRVGERGFARTLVTQIRADAAFTKEGRIDREFLRLLKRAASVTVVCIGVESADDADLARIHKHANASRTARALRAMRRSGLVVHGMFIAFAEDTADVIRRNGLYARKCVSSLQYLFETPLPGTKRTREHEESGRMLFRDVHDLALFDGMHVVLRPEKMTPAQMQANVVAAYRRFYSLPRLVWAAVRGFFGRFRRLTEAQRAYLAEMPLRQRIAMWARLHLAYKFAQVGFLAVGRRRVRDFLRDPDYARYLELLQGL